MHATDELIETVARAIRADWCEEIDSTDTWKTMRESTRNTYRSLARAALAVIPEQPEPVGYTALYPADWGMTGSSAEDLDVQLSYAKRVADESNAVGDECILVALVPVSEA